MADYSFWRAALAGEFGQLSEGDAHPGFWRRRVKSGGAFLPVAIWPNTEGGLPDQLIALCDGHQVDAAEIFSFCCRYPVTEEAYRQRVETGRWPDEDQALAESLAPPDHNRGPTDPKTTIREAIDACLKSVSDYDRIDTDEAAAKAQGLRSRLLELSNQADKEREKQVRPHLDAQKDINGAWMPLVKDAKGGADALRQAASAYETRQRNARLAEEAKAQEALRKAQETGTAQPAGEQAPVQQEQPKTQLRSAYGRAAAKKLIKVATVTDQDALYPFLKTHKEMIDLMGRLAQRAVDAGMNPPGVVIEEKVDVR